MSRMAHPAFAQPLSVLSLNMSKRQRNHTMRAAIQMKNQKLHSRTSPKSLVIASIVWSSHEGSPPCAVKLRLPDERPLRALSGRRVEVVTSADRGSSALPWPFGVGGHNIQAIVWQATC